MNLSLNNNRSQLQNMSNVHRNIDLWSSLIFTKKNFSFKRQYFVFVFILKIEIKLEDLVFMKNFINSTFRYTQISFSRAK